jgi:hypothetical protein
MRFSAAAALLIPAGLAGLTAACSSTPTPTTLWVLESDGGVDDHVASPGKEVAALPDRSRVDLTGAGNETLSFRFALRGVDGSVANPAFHIPPFVCSKRRIDPSIVRVFRMHQVAVGDFPGWHVRSIPPDQRNALPMDVLVPIRAPRGGLPAKIPPRETLVFWVDVAVPKYVAPGSYVSEFQLLSEETPIAVLDVHLEVLPFTLPDESDIPVIAEVDHVRLFTHHVHRGMAPAALDTNDWRHSARRRELDAALQSAIQLLRRHGVTPVLDKLAPRITVNATGEIVVDWGHYDAVVSPLLDGGGLSGQVPLAMWPLPVHGVFSSRHRAETSPSPGYAKLLHDYLVECARHFTQHGWLKRSYGLPPYGAADSPGAARPLSATEVVRARDSDRDLAAVARSADGRIATVSRLWPQDMAPYGWVDFPASDGAHAADIWLPPAQFFDREAMAAERAGGRRTWMAVDRPPFSGTLAVHAPPGYARVLVLQARQLGAQALYLGCVNAWPDAVDHPDPEACIRTDPEVLLYPGGPWGLNEPVPSVRLKELRRSLQDAAYRTLLNTYGLQHITATLGRSLAPCAGTDAYRTHFADGRPAGWVEDPAAFTLAREIMIDSLLEVRTGDSAIAPAEDFAATTTWRRFMLSARRLHINVDGSRVRLRGSRMTGEADLECALTIVNRKRVPVAGTVSFLQLPPGWTAFDETSVASIPPNGTRRVTLTASVSALPTGAGLPELLRQVRDLPIELTTEAGITHRTEARLSCVTAAPVAARRTGAMWPTSHADGRIRIDGDLSDWPPGAINVASRFTLITGRGAARLGNGNAAPRQATMGFVMRDATHLYIAINCEADLEGRSANGIPTQPSSSSRSNRVVYDDLIPTGDELAEILIDPLNAGTRSPGDLYHIAVKPSGAYIVEKGLRLEPPCGPHEPWSADLDVATGVYEDRWAVELRIPLRSFEAPATEHTVWGFNITRFDASRQEFSTWSGASGNAYDPLSLGNLYLP